MHDITFVSTYIFCFKKFKKSQKVFGALFKVRTKECKDNIIYNYVYHNSD